MGDSFSLLGFVNQFLDFIWGCLGAFLVPTVPTEEGMVSGGLVSSVPGENCPLPGICPENNQTVGYRTACASCFPGISVPCSLVEVTFLGRTTANSRTAHLLYSVWFEETRAVTQVVNAWNRAHPNAQSDTVDKLLLQVRMPTAPTAMTVGDLLTLGQGVNYEAPVGVHQVNALSLP